MAGKDIIMISQEDFDMPPLDIRRSFPVKTAMKLFRILDGKVTV